MKPDNTRNREKRIAAEVGGERQPLSGARYDAKGDVKTDKLLIDCKHRQTACSVSAKMLDKITNEARGAGKEPALVITIPAVAVLTDKDWIVLPLRVFQGMVERVDKENNER